VLLLLKFLNVLTTGLVTENYRENLKLTPCIVYTMLKTLYMATSVKIAARCHACMQHLNSIVLQTKLILNYYIIGFSNNVAIHY